MLPTQRPTGLSKLIALFAILPAVALALTACDGSSAPEPLQRPGTGIPVSGATFSDITAETGIDHVFSVANTDSVSDPVHMGGGLAAADFDGDGLTDLYFVAGNGSRNALFRNDGDNRFLNVSAAWGLDVSHLGSGPAFADLDGDRDLDLFVGGVDGDRYFLFRQDPAGFTDMTDSSGLTISAQNTFSAGFSDYDMDGDLDLVLSHWGNGQQPDTQTLWQNNGDGTFTSASIQSRIAEQLIGQPIGMPGSVDYTFAPVFSDIDRDGDPDLLFAADFGTSMIFENNGDATFRNTTDRNVIVDHNGMGSVTGDYDNDGDIDWFVTSIFGSPGSAIGPRIGNRLYRNDGNGTFADVTDAAGVADGGWGWAACMQDFDNDGDLDIFHVNGWNKSDQGNTGNFNGYAADQVRYFESRGDGTFLNVATDARLTDTGQGRGAACFDSDRDGDIDIVLTNNHHVDSVVFYRNELSSNNHWLGIRLVGKGLNGAGIGARIDVTVNGRTQVREISASNNFVSQSPAEAHFGLGASELADVVVYWPDGGRTELNAVAADQLLTIGQN